MSRRVDVAAVVGAYATGDVAWLVAKVLRRRGAKRAPRGFVVKDTLLF